MKKLDTGTNGDFDNEFDPWNLLRVAIGALQLAGLVAIAGFMFINGRETFLGVRSPHTVSDLGFGMGEFCMGAILVLLHHIGRFEVIGLLFSSAVVVCLAPTQGKRFLRPSQFLRNLRYAALTTSFLVAFGVVAVFELPVANLNNALSTNISDQCQSSSQTVLSRQSCRYWGYLETAHGALGASDTSHTMQSAVDVLERWFTVSAIATLLAWCLLYRARLGGDPINQTLQVIAVAAVLCASILLPYTFGKLFGWAWTPNISIFLKGDDQKTTDKIADEKQHNWSSGYLLDASERSIFVVNFDGDVVRLKEYPRSVIMESDTMANEDVLAIKLQMKQIQAPSGGE